MTTTDLHNAFPHKADLFYLNHAAVGPWPRCTQEAVSQFAMENLTQGASDYPKWQKKEDQLKLLLKTLIHAESVDEIALAKNTSEALSIIAHGINWQAGDNVVLSAWEFPSNRIVWESLSRYGVEVRIVNCDQTAPEKQLIAACDAKTRLLSSSSVHYADGFRMDLTVLGDYCHKKGILFCVDAIQSLGALPFDAQACHADFVVADGHKWMLAPEGLALFYCQQQAMEQLTLNQFGWHMVEHLGDYDRDDWQVAISARRFECGSPNMLGAHALCASLDYLINDISIQTVYDNISRNISYLFDFIENNKKLLLQSDSNKQRRSGIVNFLVKDCDNKRLYETLMQNRFICAYRHGGIRLAPHFYQTERFMQNATDKLMDAIKQL